MPSSPMPGRLRRCAVVFGVGMSLVAPAASLRAQDQNKDARKQQEKMDQGQRQEVQALVKAVDAAMSGQPAPADFPVQWQNDFLKAQENRTYVPFTITLDPARFTAPAATLYLRVVARGMTTPPAPADDKSDDRNKSKKDDKKNAGPVYPFEDVHFLELKGSAPEQGPRVSRAFAVPSGDYDVFLAVRERVAAGAQGAAPKMAVVKQEVSVPNFWSNELTTSSLILADNVEPVTEPPARDQQNEHPYTLGTTKIVPAVDNKFSKKEELAIIFLVYNPSLSPEKKPDVEVEYSFQQKTTEGEKYFNRTEPQKFNAQTLPPQFDLNAGHQLVVGQSVPLASFPEGDYRLDIKVTDKLAGKALTREVVFTVVGS
ncbi:MAG: hypothetical protein LC804_27200 [Acidobacteria bacterium]|nr:hypothetical protein [Acidobacteriota bacterium]